MRGGREHARARGSNRPPEGMVVVPWFAGTRRSRWDVLARPVLCSVTMRNHAPVASILETPYFDEAPSAAGLGQAARTGLAEQRLMAAVLNDAVRCWRRSSSLRGRRAARLRGDLHDWFASEATDWPFSFVNACDHLGLDPETVRGRIGLRFTSAAAA